MKALPQARAPAELCSADTGRDLTELSPCYLRVSLSRALRWSATVRRWGEVRASQTSPASQFSSFQSLSRVQLFVTPGTAARQASLSITNSWSLLKPMPIESVMPSNHLILCRPLLLLPSVFPSIRVFSNESALRIRWPKDWSFSFSISPSNEYSGLISFRMDRLDLFSVQGTLKSLLQHQRVGLLFQAEGKATLGFGGGGRGVELRRQ